MLPWIELHTINVGFFTIQVWGLMAAIGILSSYFFLKKEVVNKNGISLEVLSDLLFWALIYGFIGARIAHIVFYEPAYFIANPLEIIAVWKGGMSSFGGIIGGIAGAIYLFKKKNIKDVRALVPSFSIALLIGWIFGRIGCFLIHDHKGIICDVGCPLHAVSFDSPNDGPILDVSFLELLLLVPFTAIVLFTKLKKDITLPYKVMVFYGLTRLFLDQFRSVGTQISDPRLFGLTPGQYFAILMIGFGLLGIAVFKKYLIIKYKNKDITTSN